MNPWQDRLLWLSLSALFIGVPISNAISSIGMGLLGISAIILVYQNGFPKPFSRYKPLVGLGIFFVFYLISSLYSTSILVGLNDAFRQHAFISIPLCFWVISDWIKPRIRVLLQLFIAACTLHCILTIGFLLLSETMASDIIAQFSFLKPYPELTDRLKFGLYTPFLERLNLAYIIGFAILYLIYDAFYDECKWHHWFQGVILIVAFVLIGARGAQLALLGGLFLGALSSLIAHFKNQGLTKNEYQQKLTSAITVVVIITIAVPFLAYKSIPAVHKRYDQLKWELRLIENGDYLNEEYQYFTSLTRIRAFENAVSVIKDHPILGSGIGDYRDEMKKANATHNDRVPVHNQNFFLYVWGTSGLLALLVFLWGIWNYIKSFWKDEYGTVRHLALAYVLFVCLSCLIDAFPKYHIGNTSVMLFLSTLFLIKIRYRPDVD